MLAAALVFSTMALAAPPPDAAPGARSGEQLVRFQCVLCHGAGMAGAPKIGDRNAWEKRANAGLDTLVRSATEGRGAMPPNGGLADVTPQELRGAIDYMLQSSGAKR